MQTPSGAACRAKPHCQTTLNEERSPLSKLLCFALVAALAICLSAPRGAAAQTAVTVPLHAVDGSGQEGMATISAVSAQETRVVIQLAGGAAAAQPAHIHAGVCSGLDPKPAYPLNDVVNGHSDTTLAIPMARITEGGYFAINVHKSAAEIGVYVACGDIPVTNVSAQAGAPASPSVGPGGTSNPYGCQGGTSNPYAGGTNNPYAGGTNNPYAGGTNNPYPCQGGTTSPYPTPTAGPSPTPTPAAATGPLVSPPPGMPVTGAAGAPPAGALLALAAVLLGLGGWLARRRKGESGV
jgi:hypothetical protein